MGHTLVTRFDKDDYEKLTHQLSRGGALELNKIPFGRDCDRSAADNILRYHITIAHWAKSDDDICFEKLKQIVFMNCEVMVTGVATMFAEEGSLLLCFRIKPGENFLEMTNNVRQILPSYMSDFWHMTLGVSKEQELICAVKHNIEKNIRFPFSMRVTGLDLYKIWRPTEFVRTFFDTGSITGDYGRRSKKFI